MTSVFDETKDYALHERMSMEYYMTRDKIGPEISGWIPVSFAKFEDPKRMQLRRVGGGSIDAVSSIYVRNTGSEPLDIGLQIAAQGIWQVHIEPGLKTGQVWDLFSEPLSLSTVPFAESWLHVSHTQCQILVRWIIWNMNILNVRCRENPIYYLPDSFAANRRFFYAKAGCFGEWHIYDPDPFSLQDLQAYAHKGIGADPVPQPQMREYSWVLLQETRPGYYKFPKAQIYSSVFVEGDGAATFQLCPDQVFRHRYQILGGEGTPRCFDLFWQEFWPSQASWMCESCQNLHEPFALKSQQKGLRIWLRIGKQFLPLKKEGRGATLPVKYAEQAQLLIAPDFSVYKARSSPSQLPKFVKCFGQKESIKQTCLLGLQKRVGRESSFSTHFIRAELSETRLLPQIWDFL